MNIFSEEINIQLDDGNQLLGACIFTALDIYEEPTLLIQNSNGQYFVEEFTNLKEDSL